MASITATEEPRVGEFQELFVRKLEGVLEQVNHGVVPFPPKEDGQGGQVKLPPMELVLFQWNGQEPASLEALEKAFREKFDFPQYEVIRKACGIIWLVEGDKIVCAVTMVPPGVMTPSGEFFDVSVQFFG